MLHFFRGIAGGKGRNIIILVIGHFKNSLLVFVYESLLKFTCGKVGKTDIKGNLIVRV